MRIVVPTVSLLLLAAARGIGAEPMPLPPELLDRLTAGATAAAELALGDAALPQVQPDPPRGPRELARWLRSRVVCSLPGRACVQG
jgi:hypothetical protein